MRILRHLLAILLLPVAGIIIIPWLIIYLSGSVHVGWELTAPWKLVPSLAGITAIVAGTMVWLLTVVLFERVGKGTLAPWDPPKRLVVRGVYRHVRNPMITSVACVLLGEAVFFGSILLFCWFLVFAVVNLVYTPLMEEPALARRFGDDYLEYKKHVPRWIPRVTPWAAPWKP